MSLDAPARALLDALAQRYADRPFSARDAAAGVSSTLWLAAGVSRLSPEACGKWLRYHRGPELTGKADRTGVVQWRVRLPEASGSASAALPAPAPAQRPVPPASSAHSPS